MNKELTPIEALNKLYDYALGKGTYSYGVCYNIIEKALKRLEEIDNRPFINGIREEIPADAICKKLKALEIIKEKEVDVRLFKMVFLEHHRTIIKEYGLEDITYDYEGYLYNFEVFSNKELEQEEFDLLKEVLK